MQTVIDISTMRQNIRKIRSVTRNEFCAVIKSDAYGHGIAVAKNIEPVVDCFMVATADEAFDAAAIVRKSIITLGGDICPFTRVYSPQIIPTVCDVSELNAVVRSGYKRFSVAVNTGMNRLGASEDKLRDIVSYCKQNDIAPWSVYSHLYAMSAAPEQSWEFDRLTSDPILRTKRHMYCSTALDLNGFDLYDMTRCGIAMYGYHTGMDICMRVRAKIVGLSHVARGQHIGYGAYVLGHDALIATVRCGYADGLRRTDR
ncbi:MAG: alanine racemase, partial [Clostridiales bacterium]|nr:alanine racemase [Clostridiales bacterium]